MTVEPPFRPDEAVVRTRVVLTLVEGIGTRLFQVLSPRGAARSVKVRTLAVLFAGADIVRADRLRSDERFKLGRRLLVDAADVAIWCCAAGDDPDSSEAAFIPGVALAAEAGARLGPAGLVVPIVNAAVAAGVRRARGHPLRMEQASWQLMGTVGGWMLRLSAGRRRSGLGPEREQELDARIQEAEFAGLHDAVMEHEGAIDMLQRATALIELSGLSPGPRRNPAGLIKASMAESARSRASYLREVLMRWERQRNLEPDLARTVSVELSAEDGTILLSRAQADRLVEVLEGFELRGHIRVEADSGTESRRPGGARAFRINSRRIVLDGQLPYRHWTFDVLPTAFLMNIGWLLQPMSQQREAVPPSAAAVPVCLNFAALVAAAYRADRRGRWSPNAALGSSFAVTILYTFSSVRHMRNSHTPDGVSRFPWTLALQGYDLVRLSTENNMSPAARWLGGVGTATIAFVGWRLSPPPRSVRALAAELAWIVGFDIFARHLQVAISTTADDELAAWEEATRARVAAAYLEGGTRGQELIREALEDACSALTECHSQLDPPLAMEAGRRLDEVERTLAASRSQVLALASTGVPWGRADSMGIAAGQPERDG